MVIPRERTRTIQQNYLVPSSTRAMVPWDDYKPNLLRNMCTDMARKLVEDRAFLVEELQTEHCGEACTLVLVEARVIMPKGDKVGISSSCIA
jgi:hypothetical protein